MSADTGAGDWPAQGLESPGACPVCASPERSLMLEGLTDTAFRTAPGRWTLWRCQGCGGGYLNPRPTPATISMAYGRYYTHDAPIEPPAAGGSRLRRLKTLLRRSYVEWRYGAGRGPLAWLGPLAGRLRPSLARQLDYGARYLRRPARVAAPRLLDVGCGNGAFLRAAGALGWQVCGCDFDARAVGQAQASGAEIRLGGAEAFADRQGQFDAVTLSHVIEHVHDPAALLDQVRALLRPGGLLFVDTPNLEAAGLAKFGPAWRGLEPPRHLVLFTWASLKDLLAGRGFVDIVEHPQPQIAEAIWRKSDRLRQGKDPYDTESPYSPGALEGLPPLAARPARGSEFVTLTARRPAEGIG